MKKYHYLLTLILFLSLNTSVGLASEAIAFVVKSQNMPGYPEGHKMPANTVIKTTGDQRLALKTEAGDTVIIGENSNFKLVKPSLFSHVFGKIYYYIRSRSTGRLKVRSHVATLGVRGTKFIISSSDKDVGQVALAEGLLDIESNDDQPFAITSKRELTEFERYRLESLREMQGINDEFERYKKEIEQEFIEYKKSFELTENTTLSFSGKKVEKMPLSEKQKEEFSSFEDFIGQVENQKAEP